MSFNPLNMKEWSMSEFEIAKYSPPIGDPNAVSSQLYIPKLMPLIQFDAPKIIPKSLSKACFINDEACKPSPAAQINTQNYKTILKPTNRRFFREKYTQGEVMQVEVKNGNPDEMYISTKVDNSSGKTVTETYYHNVHKGKGTVTLSLPGVMPGPGVTVNASLSEFEIKSESEEWHTYGGNKGSER